MRRNLSTIAILFSIFSGGLSVLMGALGAHAFDSALDKNLLNQFETAVEYQMFHSLIVLLVGLFNDQYGPNFFFELSMMSFVLGIIVFCFSLYALTLFSFSGIAFIVPIGGIFLMAGWALFFVAFLVK